MIYAPPNTGKTLITLRLLTDAIREKRIEGGRVVYMNADDSSSGLAVKAAILEEFGVHLIAPGFNGFKVANLMGDLDEMVRENTVDGQVLILDTAKTIASLMDKRESSAFTDGCRQFVMNGGTILALGHTNKRRETNGNVNYSGTSDVVDDFDAAYIINTLPVDSSMAEKVVEFSNIKRRGNNASSVAYSYATETNVFYAKTLASVQLVDPNQVQAFKQVAAEKGDAVVIEAVSACVAEGTNMKMALARESAARCKVSERAAMRVIEQYTGNDPRRHRWTFSVKERGAKVFQLLQSPADVSPAEA